MREPRLARKAPRAPRRVSVARVDAIVAGAGVVGLAVARALALAGRETIVIEAETAIGTATSSRNSEVIHAGIYYPPGSLKARLCVAGRQALYEFCRTRGIAHRACGKMIVATEPAQGEALDTILARAKASGVDDLARLTRAQALALEPHVQCVEALLSPSTGIIDSHSYMLALQGDIEAHGGQIAFGTSIAHGALGTDGARLECLDIVSGETFALEAPVFVNAAGLGAVALAKALDGFPRDHIPGAWLARGCYFSLAAPAPFRRLVYPVPAPGGLGVHLTLDLGGQARFGPDVEWIDTIDYTVDPRRADGFYAEIRRYWPALPDHALMPAYAGIRPKISGPGEPAADFRIDGPAAHGAPGVVHLFGIESPGLTASLAIADEVVAMLDQ
jgi:L-2-hydroxyglutarate oxidase LhgO